ncbi:MAG TPA: rod shape-determining protein MreC [Bryobacteraceae bacterium]
MESFLNRYRNITVLLLVIFAQLVLLALQVKNDQNVRMIRVWAVTAVTPAARVVEFFRGGGVGFVQNYILLHDTHDENRKLKAEVDRLKIENIFLKNELNTADRAKALMVFQAHTPSKMVAANVISTGAGSNSKVVYINRGTAEGVMRGMAVVTPDGIVGKVIAAYPTASEVALITDADFAAGVISQKNGVRGTLKGQGTPICKVDYVPFEDKVEVGDWFYTSGDDRIFPRGFPVGVVKAVRQGQSFKEILVDPSGLQHGVEDVLVLTQAVHQDIPDTPPTSQPVYIAPPPPGTTQQTDGSQPVQPQQPQGPNTEADKLRATYKALGDAQNHNFGEGAPGAKPANFNIKLPTGQGLQPPPLPPAAGAGKLAGTGATGATGARPAATGATGVPQVAAPRPAATGATGATGAPRGPTGASETTAPRGQTGSTGAVERPAPKRPPAEAPAQPAGPGGRGEGREVTPGPDANRPSDAARRANQSVDEPGRGAPSAEPRKSNAPATPPRPPGGPVR